MSPSRERGEPRATAAPSFLRASVRALGRRELPERVDVVGAIYSLERTLQHSFFAATGSYRGPRGRIVVKMGRQAAFFGFPLRWLGRWLGRREIAFYERLQDLPGVPECLGPVGETGFAHLYVEGRPHWRYGPLPNAFFESLREQITEMHRRDIAYVDLQKPENLLVGDDGAPHLIDLQTAFWWPERPADRRGLKRIVPHRMGRRLLALAQEADSAHVLVHWRRSSPEGLTPAEIERSLSRSEAIRWHAKLRRPYRRVRRFARGLFSGTKHEKV